MVYLLELRPFLGVAIGICAGGVLAIVLPTEFDWTRTANSPPDWRVGWISVALYVAGTIWIFRPIYRERPVAQYVLFGLMAGVLGYLIYRGQSRRHVLPQLLIFAFITYWSSQFAFPVGINGPDTFAFIPASTEILNSGHIPRRIVYKSTPLHMIYVSMMSLVNGESVQLSYYLGSIFCLLVSVALVSALSEAIPSLDRRTALFAALVFAISSFSLQRGMYPTKLNFFKPLIMIGILAAYHSAYSEYSGTKFVPIVLVCVSGLVFGHTYSTGILMIVVGVLAAFSVLVYISGNLDYSETVPAGSMVRIALIPPLALFGYAFGGTTGIIGRLQSIALSILAPLGQSEVSSASGSGGGRYATLSLDVLLFSTASQTILFLLSVVGCVVLIRRRDWGFDSILVWIVAGLSLIGFSLVFNAVDIPTPRVYTLLAMFGLNIAVVVGIFAVARVLRGNYRGSVAAVIIVIFAVTSLASPVAGMTLSPLGDDIPHFRKYTTPQEERAEDWHHVYSNSNYWFDRTHLNAPTEPVSEFQETIDRNRISMNQSYVYTDLARRTGILSNTSSTGLGGRSFTFVRYPITSQNDNIIYQNGQETVFLRK
ncbi:hypothetical protein [Salinigranum halophilum]|uniref:hypothetical protein n=1 Tax=Salinigranum halophilum TaxID=2565931 RepID=UPI0010A8F802|nr:hypothetical protein [Salinigranum halophilum]